MCFRCITTLVTGALLAVGPALALAQGVPVGRPTTIQGAHVVVIDGSAQHELTADAVQIAHSEMNGTHNGNMIGSMTAEMALSAASVVAGPVASLAAPIISLFHHASPPKPTMQMLLALPGTVSSNVLSNATPSFTIDYADIPGINPEAYTPELVKLTQTKDNWRIVALTESSDPSAFASLYTNGMAPSGIAGSHQAPKITESRVDYANVTVASRGHATITLARALDPGEYGIVLRPPAATAEVTPASLLTVWDFSVHN